MTLVTILHASQQITAQICTSSILAEFSWFVACQSRRRSSNLEEEEKIRRDSLSPRTSWTPADLDESITKNRPVKTAINFDEGRRNREHQEGKEFALCALQKSLPRSRDRSASSPLVRPLARTLASCELLFCRARRATGDARRSPHWNNPVDGWMDGWTENFWKLFFTKRVPLWSKSLELGKVEIGWILDEDLWKTLYNKTSTLINPWMIKLEQTSCTLCMNKFHLTLDKF